MRRLLTKLLVLAGVAGATGVFAQELPGYTRLFQETQALSRSAPSAATDGMLLDSVYAYRISVCTASGQTLTSGTLQMYVYDTDRALWMRNPAADETISVTAGTQRCQEFPDRLTGVSVGRMLPACASVVVSSGTTCAVQVKAFLRRGIQGR